MTDGPAAATPAELLAERQAETLDEHPDPFQAALEKCKPAKHLRVIVERGAATTIATRYVADLVCRNQSEGPPVPTWGALLDPAGKQVGMHLFPDAVDLLAHQLPLIADAARESGHTDAVVSIQHTVKKQLATWRSVTPDDADTIAGELGAMP